MLCENSCPVDAVSGQHEVSFDFLIITEVLDRLLGFFSMCYLKWIGIVIFFLATPFTINVH